MLTAAFRLICREVHALRVPMSVMRERCNLQARDRGRPASPGRVRKRKATDITSSPRVYIDHFPVAQLTSRPYELLSRAAVL